MLNLLFVVLASFAEEQSKYALENTLHEKVLFGDLSGGYVKSLFNSKEGTVRFISCRPSKGQFHADSQRCTPLHDKTVSYKNMAHYQKLIHAALFRVQSDYLNEPLTAMKMRLTGDRPRDSFLLDRLQGILQNEGLKKWLLIRKDMGNETAPNFRSEDMRLRVTEAIREALKSTPPADEGPQMMVELEPTATAK